MIKENNGRLLGELDHPEGRFDIQMKEASHMITDLWYDEATHCVMGRLEVLDTPNGKTLKSLIDAGFPLYVSSRAAGDVNEKTKEVEIAQIFTYDVVCTPGFKEARLERVNESLLSSNAVKYLNEARSLNESAKKTEIIVPASVLEQTEVARFNNIKINQVNKPLFEDDDMGECDNQKEIDGEKVLNDGDAKNFYRMMNTSGKPSDISEKDKKTDEDDNDDNDDEKDNDKKEEKKELSDSEKEENRDLILNIVGLDNDGEPVGNSADDSENSEKEEKKDEIENIEGVKKEKKGDEKSEDEKSDDDEKTEKEETEETNESNDKISKEANKKINNMKKETKNDLDEIDSILNSVKKAEEVKESIIRRYPFAISLSESNFAKFAQLRPNQKKRCAEFIEEHNIFDIKAINELWTTPLRADKKMQQNWLRLASQSDIDLYCAAPVEVQNMIEENAQLFVLDTQEDVDNFWNGTGLRQEAYRKSLNEQVVDNFKSAFAEKEKEEKNPLNESCGYDLDDFIKMTEMLMR